MISQDFSRFLGKFRKLSDHPRKLCPGIVFARSFWYGFHACWLVRENGGESGGGVDDGVFYGGSFGRASEGAQTAVTVATAAEAAAEVAPRGGMGYGCPRGSQLVAIEMGGEPLETFVHPERAIYILGSEDTGLADSIVQAAHHHVALPSVRSRTRCSAQKYSG